MPLDSSDDPERKILFQAMALPPAQRAAFLQKACGDDADLRGRLEVKLKAELILLALESSQPAPALTQAAIAEPGETLVIDNAAPRAPPRIPAAAAALGDPYPPSHGRFLPGAKIASRYRIVSLAGKGGMGEVYRADDLKLGQPVALKFLPAGLDPSSPLLRYFLDEVRLARQITHPNVCRVYDVGEVEGQHFLSMEYIDGEDLRSLLRRIGRLPPDKGRQIAQQLCAGLAAAHDRGVLHRDLKPANIMIDGQGRARITDFGLARLADGQSAGEIVGTPAYMAPEQSARGETTVQTDLYSLGLVLLEMFTGQSLAPPGAATASVQAESRARELLTRWAPELDPTVERAILQCLEEDPQRRPRSARAIAALLPGGDLLAAALAAGETPSPEMIAAAGGEGMLARRTGLIWLAGVIAGLLLGFPIAQSTYRVNRAGIDKHPQAMAADCRRIIQGLGLAVSAKDWAFGYADQGPDNMHFWYRQRPGPLINFEFWEGFNRLSYGQVLVDHPALDVPGEVALKLTPRGELLSLRVVPLLFQDTRLERPEPQWTRWFPPQLIGFDLDRLEKVSGKMPRPADPYDHWQVWRGIGPRGDDFYVEAAAYAGQPVWFDVLEGWRLAPARASPSPGPQTVMGWMFLAVILGAGGLAWHNLRLRRSDRRGAFRVAFYFFWLGLATTALQAHHGLSADEGGIFEMAVAQAASRAIIFWLWYTALEPYVRRLWPQALISWTRLLEGRWRDPLVGRDVLIGCLFGAALNLAHQLHLLAPQWLGQTLRQFQSSPGWTLAGPGSLMADVLFKQTDAVFFALFFLMSLVLLRFALRRTWLAAAAFLLLFTAVQVFAAGPASLLDWLATTLGVALIFSVLVRWGFLASAISLLCVNFLTFPLTTDSSVWYASRGLLGAGLVLAMALFGRHMSKPATSR